MFISAHIVLKQTRYEALSKLSAGVTVNADGPSWKCPTAYP